MEINKPVATIIILIINLILIFLFVAPKYQESNNLQLNLAQKQIEYDAQSDYYGKVLEALKSINDRKDVLEKIDSALPLDFSLASVIYFLQNEAIENQLNIKSITFSKDLPQTKEEFLSANSNQEVKSVGFAVNLSGSYQGFKKFLSDLDKSVRLFQVDRIYFSSPQGSSSELTYSPDQFQIYDFSLEIKIYTY